MTKLHDKIEGNIYEAIIIKEKRVIELRKQQNNQFIQYKLRVTLTYSGLPLSNLLI